MKITKRFIGETSGKELISIIPLVGGPISSVLSDFLAERKQQRLNEFFTRLKEDLDKVQERVDKEFISKEDFLDIFELTAKKIMEERKDVKRNTYRQILVNGITKANSGFDDVEQCIRVLENLTENNIILLTVFSDPVKHNSSISEPVKRPTGNMLNTTLSKVLRALLPGWQGGLILENLKDLEFLGLVQPLSANFQTMITANGLSPVVNALTPKGERFVRYLI